MYLKVEERWMYDRTETQICNLWLKPALAKEVGFQVSSIEEVECLSDAEIRKMFSHISKKGFAEFLAVVNQFRKEDLEKAKIHLGKKQLISIFDKIVESWASSENLEMLNKTGLTDEEINFLVFRERYVADKMEDINLIHLGVPVRINFPLGRNGIKTIGDVISNWDKVKSTYHIGKKSIEELNFHIDGVKDWCKSHPMSEIPDDRKIDMVDDIVDVLCEGKNRRYVRAYLRSVYLNDWYISHILHAKFPNEDLGVTIC